MKLPEAKLAQDLKSLNSGNLMSQNLPCQSWGPKIWVMENHPKIKILSSWRIKVLRDQESRAFFVHALKTYCDWKYHKGCPNESGSK